MNLAWGLLELAAWLHLCQAPGSWYLAKYVVPIEAELPRLSPLVGAIMQVMGIAVVLVLVMLGILIGTHPAEVLGTSLGFSLCAFLGCFWLARLGMQFVYYTRLPWPRTRAGRISHAVLVGIFAAQSSSYLAVCALRLMASP